MAWTTPNTAVAGALITAVDHNTYIRDNLNFLFSNAVPTASGAPHVRVSNTVNQSITTSIWTAITFDTETVDVGAMHDLVTNTGRITFATAGFYLVIIHFYFASNATGYRSVRVPINGSGVFIAHAFAPAVNGDVTTFYVPFMYQFAASDFITFEVWQNSGAALAVVAQGNHSPIVSAAWQAL